MASYPPSQCCATGFRHEGSLQGKTIQVAGYEAYLATPAKNINKDVAILYLPDIIGVWQNSKLLCDEFANAGYLTLMIDYFNGDPVSLKDVDSGALEFVDYLRWVKEGSNGDNPHDAAHVDPIVVKAIDFLKNEHGIKKIGSVGYCFGAKYLVRHYKSGIDVGYVAHPSFMEEEELAELGGPLAIAAAEDDHIFPPEMRAKTEQILSKAKHPWQLWLYGRVKHGFAVRCDLSVGEQKFAKEQAYSQAIQWFNHYLLPLAKTD